MSSAYARRILMTCVFVSCAVLVLFWWYVLALCLYHSCLVCFWGTLGVLCLSRHQLCEIRAVPSIRNRCSKLDTHLHLYASLCIHSMWFPFPSGPKAAHSHTFQWAQRVCCLFSLPFLGIVASQFDPSCVHRLST